MEKPRLSFWQVWNMSFGFLGIQFGWTLQMNNMSAIYEYLGAQPSQLPILWLAAPLTGLIMQAIIGYWRDNTWSRLGRRRPFFLVGAPLSSCALVLMPLSGTLWMAARLLWILDASINISMEPFRAFVPICCLTNSGHAGSASKASSLGWGGVAASYLPFLLPLVRIFRYNRLSCNSRDCADRVLDWLGRRGTHSLCLLAGAAGLISIAIIHNRWLLFMPMLGIGIAWASILSMPYSILAAAIPSNKMGIYMGIFNFFIVIPEILSSLFFGWVMANLLGNDRMKAVIVGGVCFIIAALLMQRVREVTVRDESLEPLPVAHAA